MKNLRLVAAMSLAAVMSALPVGSAQAYPDSPNIVISLPSAELVGGATVSFSASTDVDCEWSVTYREGRAAGEPATQTATGKSISGSFKTKKVSETFRSPITASCGYDATPPSAAGTVSPAAFVVAAAPDEVNATASASATVTLEPVGTTADEVASTTDSGDSGILPDTGGPAWWAMIVGAVLVVVGAGAVLASRRRHTAR